MTKLYYCLAKTVVHGEIVIQGNSVTYSASASAFDSSNQSFKDAAQVATINSNAAAIIAARKAIDDILLQYAYVLSDESISSMISNNLKTSITLITPILLKEIASTVDNISYVLNKNRTILSTEFLLIPSGKYLSVPANLTFINNGIVQIGDNTKVNSNTNRAKNTNLGTGPAPCGDGGFTIPVPDSGYPLGGTWNIGSSPGDTYTCLSFVYTGALTGDLAPTVSNQGIVNINAGGQVSVSGAKFANQLTASGNGVVNNKAIDSLFFSTGSF